MQHEKQFKEAVEDYIKKMNEWEERKKRFICNDKYLKENSAAITYLKPDLFNFLKYFIIR